MNDLIFVAVTLLVFLSGILFVDGCERLRRIGK
jgi:hypothetical protein